MAIQENRPQFSRTMLEALVTAFLGQGETVR